ncbi:aspartate-tRNA(Asn) ligase [Cladophialophora carrionii CBS 160.54]|uniref:Aspartate--tRNA ligase, cytoplasmic n=1 Tax=Cladophialophora carrionii CBS 160.54 TaxID=1279043 RepID=V9DHL1_9EURO|nr:aspartate-tRNA(Asn) ligase [Cladophialophora carrionii CBS 160.54]ETI25828.1 aspartate-tRNA(Asn) ligase [Cladophialophora carrionii CBS 160.54]
MSVLRKLSKHVHPNGGTDSPKHGDGHSTPISSQSPGPHRRSLAQFLHLGDKSDYTSSDNESEMSDFDSDGMSKNAQKRAIAKQRKHEHRSKLSLDHRDDSEERIKKRLEEAAKAETDEMKSRYGDLPLMQSTTRNTHHRLDISTITEEMVDQEVVFRCRLHHVRSMGPKLVFLVFRQQISTIQGVLVEEPGKVSAIMIHWAEHLRTGNILLVKGALQKPQIPVKSASIHTVEIKVSDLHVVVRRAEPVPFSVQEAELTILDENEKVDGRQSQIPDRVRLANRIMDLRTATSQSIFRIQAAVGNLFRSSLDEQRFVEIHTPKLQGAATESGASVFKVNYFGRPAFLAQSPQLAKQMAIASDFERVYEIGAVFRAENSNTHRHLTEYTGLDLEMAIEEHYHEMMDVIDHTLKTIFKGIYTKYRTEVDLIKEQFPSEDLVWLEETPRIPFRDAVQLLTDSGWLNEDGEPVSPLEDLATRDEIRLGELMKEKYKTDYYILDKFPRSARPFYTMPDAQDERYTNSFDVFVRGQEIISGGQRIHESKMLEDNMRTVGIDPDDMAEYMEGFKWGAPPHAGCGVGLERIVMLILKLGNIRLASLFHRDPKSFPAKPVVEKLRHPEADTLNPVWKQERGREVAVEDRKLPDLFDLVANYGDATSTSWGDERYQIWRHADSGAAVCYVPEGHYAILPGDPLCHPSQYYRIVVSFLQWLKKETRLKPIWILISPQLEEVLGERLGWKTLSCVAEERVDPHKKSAESDPEVARKIRKAQSDGVKITDLPHNEPVPESIKERTNARVKDWLANRKGTQIHLSNIDLFRDEKHRRYFIAEDKDGNICGVAVMAEIAPKKGWQAKYTLDFPGAPSGTIEYITTHALNVAANAGVPSVTFGGGAANHLTPGHHMSGAKVKMLQATYDAIVKQFNLARKSEFREKMGAVADPVWIAYPPHGLGSRGIKAIMR